MLNNILHIFKKAYIALNLFANLRKQQNRQHIIYYTQSICIYYINTVAGFV